jgi:hypothetical protein
MIVTQEVNIENKCEYCSRTFVRQNTLFKHLCEQKRRWNERDNIANRIAYGAWRQYYESYHSNKKKLEYRDFINNNYYSAFLKFGSYCVNIDAINPSAFAIYLFKHRISIDNWASDRSYTQYLIEYLKNENCMDAVKRSIKNMLDLADNENIQLCDFFKYVNANKICYYITTGKISPWMLYHSSSGKQFLSNLNDDQTAMIFEYIHPERWNIKFKRDTESVREVSELIKNIPGL